MDCVSKTDVVNQVRVDEIVRLDFSLFDDIVQTFPEFHVRTVPEIVLDRHVCSDPIYVADDVSNLVFEHGRSQFRTPGSYDAFDVVPKITERQSTAHRTRRVTVRQFVLSFECTEHHQKQLAPL